MTKSDHEGGITHKINLTNPQQDTFGFTANSMLSHIQAGIIKVSGIRFVTVNLSGKSYRGDEEMRLSLHLGSLNQSVRAPVIILMRLFKGVLS